MDWLNGIFSGSMDASRVNPAGLLVMTLSVALAVLSKRISKRRPAFSENTIKIISLVICAGGALLAILG